jgi:hypothetical protein
MESWVLELSRQLRASSLLAVVLGLAVAQIDLPHALAQSAPDRLIFGPQQYLRTTGSDGGVLDTAELFDPVTLSSTALTSSLSTPRTEHTATLLPQSETLLIAGQDNLGLLFSAEMFNPGTQTFRALSPEGFLCM